MHKSVLKNVLNGVAEHLPRSTTTNQTDVANPLKICLLGYRSNPYSGGQGIYIRYLSKALIEDGHQVDVISGPPYPQLDERVNLIKLQSLDLFEEENHVTALKPKHLLSFTDFFEWFSMLTGGFAEPYTFGRRLQRYFTKNHPDYDVVHDNQSLCYGTLYLQQKSIPLVTTIHHPITNDLEIALRNTDSWKLRLLIRRWHSFIRMQKKVVSKLNYIVTVSEVSRLDIARAFGLSASKVEVIHNGIDTAVFKPLSDTRRIPYRIMATASADQPLKGLQYLLRAVALLAKTFADVHLVVLGSLERGGATEKLITSLDINQYLTFVSGIETQSLVKLYAEASIVVVPSIYEGFGLPAGEAMACGVPVISTDGGALPEVVGDAGIIVPVRDPEAIATAVADLFDHPEKRKQLSEQGRARITRLFSWQIAARDMVKLYRRVISEEKV